METLRITLFGGVHVEYTGRSEAEKITHTIQGLLSYLLLERHRTIPRDVLSALFWGDYDLDRARSCLSTALWRLRRILEPEGVPCGTYLIGANGGEVGFNIHSPYWLDIAIFEDRARELLHKSRSAITLEDAQSLENILPLYKGDVLEGFYNDWAIREREHYRNLYLDCLACLMFFARQNHLYEKGVSFGLQLLRLEPIREEIHREVMALYAANGQRALAMQQYELCCKVLKEELNVEPMEETRAAYFQIASGETRGAASGDAFGDAAGYAAGFAAGDTAARHPNLQETLRQLRQTADLVARAQEQLLQAIRALDAHVEKNE